MPGEKGAFVAIRNTRKAIDVFTMNGAIVINRALM